MANKKKNNSNEKVNNQKQYYYVSVKYDDAPEDSFAYRYISKDTTISPKDRVLVPRGNSMATGHVIECNYYEYADVPYPVEYTKYIIKKIDEDFELDEKNRTVPDEVGSFYDQLCSHIVSENGCDVLKGFEIDNFRNNVDSANIRYIEGFEENIVPLAEDKDLKLFVIGVIRNLNQDNIYESVHKIEEFYQNSEHCTKSISNEVIDELISIFQTYDVAENSGETTAEEKLHIEKNRICDLYFKFALALILYPKKVEVVKLGISMIGVFKYTKQDEIMELFLNLSLCEELAKYMAFLFSNQDDGEELLLEAAKKNKGWGRINYIEKFKFSNPEMLEWFLSEGYDNDIDSLYTSALVVKKIDLIELLKNCIKTQNSKDEKKASKSQKIISTILYILADLNEEPNTFEDFEEENSIYPIYDLESMMDIILELKDQLQNYSEFYRLLVSYIKYVNEKNAQIFDGVNSIEMQGPDYSQNIAERMAEIDEIFNQSEIEEIFRKMIIEGSTDDCNIICRVLYDYPDIDVDEELFNRYEKSPIDMFITYAHLMESDEYRDAVFEIMKKADDWEKFRGNPDPIVDSKASMLRFIIDDLQLHPFYGEDFIDLGLNSYDIYTRHSALITLLYWKKESSKPIYTFPIKILESLIILKTKEVIKDNKVLISDLLADLKDLKKDAEKENAEILKMLDSVIKEEDLENYEEPKRIYKE